MVSTTSKKRSSNVPARNRSYRTSDVVVVDVVQQEGGGDDDNNNDDNNGNSECTEKLITALHTLGGIAMWVPLIVTFFVEDYTIAFLTAFVISLFNMLVLNLIVYKFGKTRTWPKILDVIFAVMFGILMTITYSYPPSTDFLKNWGGLIVNAAIAFGIGIMWFVFGRPLSQDYVTDEVGIEALTHPVIRLFVRINTGFWLGLFIICALISLPSGIIHLKGGDPQKAFTISVILAPIITVAGFIFTYWVFPVYFFANMEKYAAPYKEEIEEWMLKYPDHQMSDPAYWGDGYDANGNKIVVDDAAAAAADAEGEDVEESV